MTADGTAALAAIEGALVVSCQLDLPDEVEPGLGDLVMALCAARGGAAGIRTNGPASVRSIAAALALPVIGLHKVDGDRRKIITPTFAQAVALADAGADLVAVEFTAETASDHAHRIRELRDAGVAVLADVSTLEEGLRAWDAGAPAVATTLSGYTPYSTAQSGPDLELVGLLASRGVRVIAEGRFSEPEEIRRAFDAGAATVVVGGAITDPARLTQRLVEVTPREQTIRRTP